MVIAAPGDHFVIGGNGQRVCRACSDRTEFRGRAQTLRLPCREQVTQSKLTGGIAAPCIQVAAESQCHDESFAERERACCWERFDRPWPGIELRCRPAKRAVGVESPCEDRPRRVDGAEQELAPGDGARVDDARYRLRSRERNRIEPSSDSGGSCSPNDNLRLSGDTETDAVAGADGDQPLRQVDLDGRGRSLRRRAVFRAAGGNPAAAVAAPTEYLSIAEQRERVISTAADRADHWRGNRRQGA